MLKFMRNLCFHLAQCGREESVEVSLLIFQENLAIGESYWQILKVLYTQFL